MRAWSCSPVRKPKPSMSWTASARSTASRSSIWSANTSITAKPPAKKWGCTPTTTCSWGSPSRPVSSEQVEHRVRKYLHYCKAAGKEVGMHAHNNLQLGFANTIEAIVLGANLLDATMAGLGRGAGNCPMELLIGFLHNPKYNLLPILRCVQDTVEPLRSKLMWGFDLPYMLTGFLNEHPRAAIKFKEAKTKGNIVDFYNQIWE